jgi:hypothetical protein
LFSAMRIPVVIVVLALLAGTARAGICLDEE